MSSSLEDKLDKLSKRLDKLELRVFGGSDTDRSTGRTTPGIESLKIPPKLFGAIRANIRRISYLDLVLLLLYHSDDSLRYRDFMSLTKELRKPVSYDWLNTEFHRKKYHGLVKSEPISGSKEKAYSLNESGRKRVEAQMRKVLALASE